MPRALKISLLAVAVVLVLSLVSLRVVGFDPPYMDPASPDFAARGRTGWPGFWLSGEVTREPVTNWDWINEVNHPVTGNAIMLETRTWYGIPHSIYINATPRGDKLYIGGGAQDFRLERAFPASKRWWANIERDPRIRMKIDGKIYEMTVSLVADRAEVAQLIGQDPVTRRIGPDGQEEITAVRHYWRVFQRNIPEYGDGSERGYLPNQ